MWAVTPGFRAALISAHARAAQANRAWRRLLAVFDQLDRMERLMGADRELLAALAATIPAIGEGVDKVVADRDSWRDRALAAEGREATDEAGDVDAAQPLKEALTALAGKVAGLVPATPPVLEEIPAVVDAAPVPDPAPEPEIPAPDTTTPDGAADPAEGATPPPADEDRPQA